MLCTQGILAHEVKIVRYDSIPMKLNNLNFYQFEVMSRYRNPQLQAGENDSY